MSAPYYQDDAVTLYHGDCREVTEWLEADVLVTDPPYGVTWGSAPMTSYTGGQGYADRIAGDETPELRDMALQMWGDNPAVVFGSWRVPRPTNTRHRLLWHKQGRKPGVTSAPWYSADEDWPLAAPRACDHNDIEWWAGAYGGARRDKYEAKYVRKGGYVPRDKATVKALLGIEHDMTWEGLFECLPPAYTTWIGSRLMAHLEQVAA